MAALSVHSSGGGTTSGDLVLQGDIEQRLADRLVGGDAAGGDQRRRARRSAARNSRRPWRRRSTTISTTASWNEAHRSATSWSDSGAIFSASRRTAVLSPDSEKSASRRPIIGRGNTKRPRSPRARHLFDSRAARIAEAEQFRGLVEGLADGVVARGAEPDIIADAAHRDDLGVPAGGEKQAIGKCASRRSAAP